MKQIDDIFLSIHTCDTTEGLWELMSEYFRSVGVKMASYHAARADGTTKYVRREGFPDTWTCQYLEENLVRIDPVPELAWRSAEPFYWHELEDLAPSNEATRRYLELLKDANMGDGLVFYVFGPAMRNAYVALGFGEDRLELSSQFIWKIQCVAQAGHLRACALRSSEADLVNLTEREQEILHWVARGKSNSVIASILSLSPHTIDAHMRRVYAKLDVNDRTSAAIRGVGSGLIKFDA